MSKRPAFVLWALLLLVVSSPIPAGELSYEDRKRDGARAGYGASKLEIKDPAELARGREEPIFSGPQAGEKLPPFTVVGVRGEREGEELDPIEIAGDDLHLLVFGKVVTTFGRFLGQLAQQLSAIESASKRSWSMSFIVVNDDPVVALKKKEWVDRATPSDVLIGLSRDGADGPPSYGLDRNLTATVIVAMGGKVVHTLAFPQDVFYTEPHILGAVASAMGVDHDTLREYIGAIPGDQAQAFGRGRRGREGAGAAGDQRIFRAELAERLRNGEITREEAGELYREKFSQDDGRARRGRGEAGGDDDSVALEAQYRRLLEDIPWLQAEVDEGRISKESVLARLRAPARGRRGEEPARDRGEGRGRGGENAREEIARGRERVRRRRGLTPEEKKPQVDWEEKYRKFLADNPKVKAAVDSGRIDKPAVLEGIKSRHKENEKKVDPEVALERRYRELLEDNPRLKAAIDGGRITKERLLRGLAERGEGRARGREERAGDRARGRGEPRGREARKRTDYGYSGNNQIKDPAEHTKAQEKTIFSGPQKGEKLASFQATGLRGELEGKDFDPAANAGSKPHLLLFTRGATGGRIVPLLGYQLGAIMKASKRDWHMSVIHLSDDPAEVTKLMGILKGRIADFVELGISKDGADGPGSYGLDRSVTHTFIFAKDGKVVHNLVFTQQVFFNEPHLLGAIADVMGVHHATLGKWLDARAEKAAGSRGRGGQGGRGGLSKKAVFRADLAERLRNGEITREEAGRLYREKFPDRERDERARGEERPREKAERGKSERGDAPR